MTRHGRLEITDPTGTLTGAGGPRAVPEVVASPGLTVEVASGSFVGVVTRCDERELELRDRRGRTRRFARSPGAFLVDDRRVTLVPPPRAAAAPGPRPAEAEVQVTASGSIAGPRGPAQVARASRILVEGVHDAELIEQVWGDDLREAAVVVEVLHGADDLAEVVRSFGPAPHRRLGILLDHLVPGSKEYRLAATIDHPDVLVTGHPFVDIWAAIVPARLGLTSWPQVPRGEDYKTGLARRLGEPDPAALWRRLRAAVTTWRDLDRTLIGAVEALLDHVTTAEEPPAG